MLRRFHQHTLAFVDIPSRIPAHQQLERIHSSSVVNGLSVFQFSSVASHAYVASLTYGGLSVMKYHEDQGEKLLRWRERAMTLIAANMDIIEFLTSHAKVPWEFSRNVTPLMFALRKTETSQAAAEGRYKTILVYVAISASRIFGDYDISVYQTETFTDQTDTFLVVAAGKSGVFLLRWDETNVNLKKAFRRHVVDMFAGKNRVVAKLGEAQWRKRLECRRFDAMQRYW
eukprot:766846-Hanusia_phi.AAC.1